MDTAQLQQILNVVIQVLVVVIPILLTWFIRTYVKGTKSEKDVAAIVRLSNSAIDLVENMDKQGQFDNLPPDVKKSVQKLQVAGGWLESELNRQGIKISDEDAKKWISSEFQKRISDVRPVNELAATARDAVDFVLNLEQNHLISLPPDADRITYLAGLAADWMTTHLSTNLTSVTRDEALSWAQTELLQRLQAPAGSAPPTDRLKQLAGDAVAFLDKLRASGQLSIRPGTPNEDVELDVATAWLLAEAARQGLAVTSAQIADAVGAALSQHRTAPAQS